MLAEFRHSLAMLPPDVRRRWWVLVPLGIVSGLFEVAVAAGLFVVVRTITTPEHPLEPWLVRMVAWLPGTAPAWIAVQLASAFAVAVVAKAAYQAAVLYFRVRVSHEAVSGLANAMLARYLAAPFSLHLTRHSSHLIRNCTTTVEGVVNGVLGSTGGLFADLLTAAGLLAVVAWNSPMALLVGVALLLGLVLGSLALTRRVAAAQGEAIHELAASGLQCLSEAFASVKDLKVLGREGFFQHRFRERQARVGHVAFVGVTLGEMPRLTIQTVLLSGGILMFAVTAAVLGPQVVQLPSLALLGYASLRLLPLTYGMLAAVTVVRAHAPAVSELYADFQSLRDSVVRRPTVTPLAFRESVTLDRVTFAYPGAPRPALLDVSLTILKGESIGVLGPTGAGKSTLVDVILGLLQPQSGGVLIDGTMVTEASAWQGRVGYVPQTLCLIDDSLRRNIALGIPDDAIDEARLAQVVTEARLEHVVAGLPTGLDTPVGERGVRLSGGERQRVAIARALYHDPAMIVFDEATSALDMETEADICAVIDALRHDKTFIIVSHRLTSLRHCTRLVLLQHGRVAATGTWESLRRESRSFRDLEARAAG